MTTPYIRLDKPLSDYALICRGCLASSGEMKNMSEWGLTEDYYKFTDVQVTDDESLSQLLCSSCEDVLSTCKRFREQCWNSNELLKNTVKVKDTSERNFTEDSPKENTVRCIQYDKKIVIMITAPDMEAKIFLDCPFKCNEKFLKKSDLFFHLLKIHHADKKMFIDLQYYCSYKDCSYSINSERNKYFSGRKYLNQHINKVHRERIQCELCTLHFTSSKDFYKHLSTCNTKYSCDQCNKFYKTHENLLVHLMRKHPEIHKQYKADRKAIKRKSKTDLERKKLKLDSEKLVEFMCDSPKRSFATQTLKPEDNIKNDVTLPSWHINPKMDTYEAKTDDISTQTVEDLLSLKSHSEDESIFFSETVSLSDIQTQTFPVEFGLSRSHKETITSETQSPDLSIKETQTCFCLYDSPKSFKFFDSVASSPNLNVTSTETQTADRFVVKSDVLLSFNSTETQTCFDENL